MVAGFRAERAALDDRGLAGGDGMLVERRDVQIPVDRSQVLEPEFVGALGAVPQSRFLHNDLRLDIRPPPEPFRFAASLAPGRHTIAPANAARTWHEDGT
jgi:hypothetical protein